MELPTNRNTLIALGTAGAIALVAGGYVLGQAGSPPSVETTAGEDHEGEEHGPEGFVAMTADRATTAGIFTEAVQGGGLAAEILAQGMVAPTPAGEAVLTARADGTVVRINRRLGDIVRAGEAVAMMDSREAAALSSERSSADARLALARTAYEREQRLYDAKVTARQDLEGARAALAEAEAEARRARSAASASLVSGDGRSLAVVSVISGRITRADATLGAFVPAGTELFRVADPNKVQVEVSVLAADVRRIVPGNAAVIELANGETRAAAVRSITPSLDPESRTATVVLQPEGIGGLTQGQGLRARIRPGGGDDGRIALPEEAVQSVEGRDVVFVRTATGFQATNVGCGATQRRSYRDRRRAQARHDRRHAQRLPAQGRARQGRGGALR